MVTKTALNFDPEKVRRAAAVLGTKGATATIDAALSEVIDREARQKLVDRMVALTDEQRVAVSGPRMLEVLVSAVSATDFDLTRAHLSAMPRVAVSESIIERALDVQGEMVTRGMHRAPSVADLVLAACAEHNGLVVLHYDTDFDLIAEATGQPAEWAAPKGTIA